VKLKGHLEPPGEEETRIHVLGRTPEKMRALGRPRPTWVFDIEIDFKEMGYEGLDRANMVLNRTRG
jgi:hypothetical protein